MNKAAIIHLVGENGSSFINAINVLAEEEHLFSDQDKWTAYKKKRRENKQENMDQRIEKIKKFRQFLLASIRGLSAEQLNRIPTGHNNNIIWNLAHLISAQQSICYVRAGQTPVVSEKYLSPFTTNTKPGAFIAADEIEKIRRLLTDSIDDLQKDFEERKFDNYSPSVNISRVYGITLNNIDDALEFLLYHEGFHSGYIISLIRMVVADAAAQ